MKRIDFTILLLWFLIWATVATAGNIIVPQTTKREQKLGVPQHGCVSDCMWERTSYPEFVSEGRHICEQS